MKAVLAGMVAAVVIAVIGAQVLDRQFQQPVDQHFSTQGVRL